MWISLAPNWAIEEIFVGICRANGHVEVAANYGGGVCRALSHNFV
jgi:hypothetical protein